MRITNLAAPIRSRKRTGKKISTGCDRKKGPGIGGAQFGREAAMKQPPPPELLPPELPAMLLLALHKSMAESAT